MFEGEGVQLIEWWGGLLFEARFRLGTLKSVAQRRHPCWKLTRQHQTLP